MRKEPRQERSRLMVERIVTSGRTVLVRDGYARFATHRVAEIAEISPGSLYQYFRDKNELLEIIIGRYWDEVSERVTASLADRFGDPPDQMVRNVSEALASALEQDSRLLRVVAEEIPPTRLEDRRQALRRRIQDLTAAFLAVTAPGDGHRVATRAWTIVTAVEALSIRWVLDQPPIPRGEFVDELTRLAEAYVGPIGPAMT